MVTQCWFLVASENAHYIFQHQKKKNLLALDQRFVLADNISFCSFLSQAGGGDKKEHLYKILVIGELGTGKTSIIKRYVHQFFSQHYRATVSLCVHLRQNSLCMQS